MGRLRRRAIFLRAATVALAYLVLACAVVGIEYRSEVNKIAHGTFSDTMTPYALSDIVSLPSSLLAGGWPGYGDGAFDAQRFARALDDYVWQAFWPILVNTVLVFGAVLLGGLGRARPAKACDPVPTSILPAEPDCPGRGDRI